MRVRFFAAAMVLGISMAGAVAQTPAPPPAMDFFKAALITDVKLSPSGRYLGLIRHIEQRGRHGLVVMDLVGPREPKVLVTYEDRDLAYFDWVGDDHLIYRLTDHQASAFHMRGSATYQIDRERKDRPKVLGGGRPLGPLRDGSPRVLFQTAQYDASWELLGTDLYIGDLVTGRFDYVNTQAPPRVTHWVVDDKGRPRVALAMAGDKLQLHWREPDKEWRLLAERPRYVGRRGFEPMMLGADGTLYGTQVNEAGFSELATLDTRQPDAKPRSLVSVQGFDFDGWLQMAPGDRVVGVHVLSDAWGSHWFDVGLRRIQEAVDKALPNTINLLDCGACDQPQRVVVKAFNDRQPGLYYLFDTASQKLELVGAQRPWIRPAQMGARSFERIKARDGLELPVHVTRPQSPSQGPWPTVVLVHGGPWLRGGSWRWEAESQFLASRGYLVIEPEFRGSAGYGSRLHQAGFKQWGQGMQDDLVDALDWAISRGWANGARVCIAGGSYGGYATLMALARDGDRFRCGVEYHGVTDINLMYESEWSDLGRDWKRYAMPDLIGDRKADAAMLAANSPLQQAARIKKPVLMAHGRQDTRVPFEHGTKMRDALRRHNPDVEWLSYAEEGHGWALDKNEADFWTRVEAFLAKHLAEK